MRRQVAEFIASKRMRGFKNFGRNNSSFYFRVYCLLFILTSLLVDKMAAEGVPDDFPLLSLSTPNILFLCATLSDHPTLATVFVASYPKSGTTWMQCIVYNLLSDGDQSFDHISNYFPFFEISRTWDQDQGTLHPKYEDRHSSMGSRAFNTHLRYSMMAQGERMRYIYVVRRGKDALLSFFHHLAHQDDADIFNGSLGDFVRDWCDGKIIFGSWLRHLEGWVMASKEWGGRVLLVRYEDLSSDLSGQMLRISQFLGLNHTAERVSELSALCSFQHMKKCSAQYEPTSVPWRGGFQFLREGRVGGSASEFSAQDHVIFDDMLRRAYPEGLPTWLSDLGVLD
ncbi:sulfotransferase domain-containing protein [archaeon]|nr:MAG: sulfotransferase domain-containing protein [archaeon]